MPGAAWIAPFRHASLPRTDGMACSPQRSRTIGLPIWPELVMEECRQRRIVVPSPAALERLCAELRHQARDERYIAG